MNQHHWALYYISFCLLFLYFTSYLFSLFVNIVLFSYKHCVFNYIITIFINNHFSYLKIFLYVSQIELGSSWYWRVLREKLWPPFSAIFCHYFHRPVVGHAKPPRCPSPPWNPDHPWRPCAGMGIFSRETASITNYWYTWLLRPNNKNTSLHVVQSIMTECQCMHVVVQDPSLVVCACHECLCLLLRAYIESLVVDALEGALDDCISLFLCLKYTLV